MKKFIDKYKNLQISSKLVLTQGLIFIFVMIILIIVSSSLMRSFFRNSEEAKLIQTNLQILDMIEVYDLSLKQSAIKTASVLKLISRNGGVESISQKELDYFSHNTDTVATIFRKEDKNFIRIKTSLMKSDGTRAVGTALDKNNPAYSFLLEQKTYTGKAKLFGKDYMTNYEPIVEYGIYTGVRFIGIDITKDLEDLKSKIRKIKIGDTGYSYVMSSNESNKGELVVHPAKEGASVLNVLAADGKDFVKEMLSNDSGLIYYSWINSERGETDAREKVVAYNKYKDWDWIIASGSYVSEIMRNGIVLITVLMSGLSIAFFVLLILLKFSVDSIVKKPLYNLMHLMDTISEGELKVERNSLSNLSKDEIGELGNKLFKYAIKIRAVISKVQSVAKKLTDSSFKMSSTSESFTESVNSQSASSEETTAALEEISASMDRIASLSTEQYTNLSRLLQTGNTLSSMIGNMEKTIHESSTISDKVSKNATSGSHSIATMKENMEKIMVSSNSITGIVRIIRDISKQINLLSLNAAIEAARAGDMGKGFAVVAEEVSKLADETARSIKNIDTLIIENNEEIKRGMKAVNVSTETISTMINDIQKIKVISSEISKQMASQVNVNRNVNTDADTVSQSSDEINTATVEQKKAISEIFQSVSKMNEMIQWNSSGAKEIAQNSKLISTLATEMDTEIEFFKI
jgi:methyl-accepting chemotaxis protein-2 (aspartate sensor receptor)